MQAWRPWCLLLFLTAQMASAASYQVSHQRHTVTADRKTSEIGEKPQKIPKLLHYVFLDGYDAFMDEGEKSDAMVLMRKFFNGCQEQHSHWDSLFWDEKMGRDLIQREYKDFLPIWDSYDSDAKRSDALRPLILHHYGGLYLDFDIECYKPSDDSFSQFDIVLQGSGNEGFNNAMMASVPGHHFWLNYLETMKKRGVEWTGPRQPAPVFMTGTAALTTAIQEKMPPARPASGYIGGVFEINGTMWKIWPIGEWFVPCYGLDHLCIGYLEDEVLRTMWDMSNVYGRHFFLETSPKKHIEHELKDYYVT